MHCKNKKPLWPGEDVGEEGEGGGGGALVVEDKTLVCEPIFNNCMSKYH